MTGLSVGPLLPVLGRWVARSSVVNLLLQVAVVAMALSSQLFPYSTSAPKRVAFQHTFVTAGTPRCIGISILQHSASLYANG